MLDEKYFFSLGLVIKLIPIPTIKYLFLFFVTTSCKIPHTFFLFI